MSSIALTAFIVLFVCGVFLQLLVRQAYNISSEINRAPPKKLLNRLYYYKFMLYIKMLSKDIAIDYDSRKKLNKLYNASVLTFLLFVLSFSIWLWRLIVE